jgi:hypothetical protein
MANTSLSYRLAKGVSLIPETALEALQQAAAEQFALAIRGFLATKTANVLTIGQETVHQAAATVSEQR